MRRKERQNSFPHRRRKVSFPDYCGFAQRVWLHRYAILKRYPEGPFFFFFSSSHTPIPCRHRRKAFESIRHSFKNAFRRKSKCCFWANPILFSVFFPSAAPGFQVKGGIRRSLLLPLFRRWRKQRPTSKAASPPPPPSRNTEKVPAL